MSPQHLGGDALPPDILGSRPSGHRPDPGHHRDLSHRVRHNNALYECYLHQWRSKRR